jgi:hypothetical protein
MGSHCLSSRTLRCYLGVTMLYTIQLRPTKRQKKPRNLSLADSLVIRSREIIDYYNLLVWFIENPQTGMLKDREFMQGIPYTDLDYCCYCDWGYKKRTRLCQNIGFQGKRCPGKGVCPNMEGRRHKSTAQQGKNKTHSGMFGETFSVHKLIASHPPCAA